MPEYSAVDRSHHFPLALKHHQRSSLAFPACPEAPSSIVGGNARLPPNAIIVRRQHSGCLVSTIINRCQHYPISPKHHHRSSSAFPACPRKPSSVVASTSGLSRSPSTVDDSISRLSRGPSSFVVSISGLPPKAIIVRRQYFLPVLCCLFAEKYNIGEGEEC
jgi:hypothetical protein